MKVTPNPAKFKTFSLTVHVESEDEQRVLQTFSCMPRALTKAYYDNISEGGCNDDDYIIIERFLRGLHEATK